MYAWLSKKFSKRAKPSRLPPNAGRVWPRKCPETSISLHSIDAQHQSPLFGKLSAELRILIYEAVLGDPVRPMHIVPCNDWDVVPVKQLVAHQRCIDMDSAYPMWQHKCFLWYMEDGHQTLQNRPCSTDKLLALLLSCRRMYVLLMNY